MASNVFTIGEVPHRYDIAQHVRGDFRWAIQFFQDDKTTPLDVSADTFTFEVFDTDGTTVLMDGAVSFLNDSTIQFDISRDDYEGTTGCKYEYILIQTTGSFNRPLFAGKFMLTK